jgi:WD40 repeat protein
VDVIAVTASGRRRFTGHTGRVNCVAADGSFLVSGGADTFVCCWRFDGGILARIPSFRGEILCIAVAAEFVLAVAGTRDGALLWINPERGAITRVVKLPDGQVPRRVMITPEWGFVVVHSQMAVGGEVRHSIAVYSVNGEKVRVKTLQYGVTAWCCWSCRKGFDHALIIDDVGCVFLCEVFWLDLGPPMDVCATPAWISFVREERSYVIVSADGAIIVRALAEECCPDGIIGGEDPEG